MNTDNENYYKDEASLQDALREDESGQTKSETEPTTTGGLATIGVKPGWQTSQGQLTAVFVVGAMILAFFGVRTTPDKLQNWYDVGVFLLPYVLPLLGSIPLLNKYIESRGKEKSNAIWATATVNAAKEAGIDGPILGASLLGLSGKPSLKDFGSIAGAVINSGLIPGKAGQVAGTIASVGSSLGGSGAGNDELLQAVVSLLANQETIEANAAARHQSVVDALTAILNKR